LSLKLGARNREGLGEAEGETTMKALIILAAISYSATAYYIQKLPEAEQLLEGVVGRPARV